MAKRSPELEWLISSLDAKNIRRECPFCSNTRWEPFNEAVAVVRAADIETGDLSGGFRALGMHCLECGFIRLHTATALTK